MTTTQQIHTEGTKLHTLAHEAGSLLPHRHWEAGAQEIAALLEYRPETRKMSPQKLAKLASDSLDQAASDWANETRLFMKEYVQDWAGEQ